MITEESTMMRKAYVRLKRYGKRVWNGSRLLVDNLPLALTGNDFRLSLGELVKLAYSPRKRRMASALLGKRLEITDSFWHLFCYREIFLEQIYKFFIDVRSPLIIDCGANIGLSVIYFKQLYPEAQIIAFEPDANAFHALEVNVKAFHFPNVTLYQKAVWDSVTELSFLPDGTVGGRIVDGHSIDNVVSVTTVRLKDFLNQHVDFLKIDIEGAEYDVIKDCRDFLRNVDYLFVEYHSKPDTVQSLHEILQIIQNAGFRYHIKDAYPIPHPFVKREKKMCYDLQLNIFGFRE